jgi:hypothetical protein
LIGTFVLCLTQIVITELILGVLYKELFSVPLFIFNISISSIIIILAIFTRTYETSFEENRDSKILFLKKIANELKDETIRFFHNVKEDLILTCIFSLFFLSLCWMIFLGYLFPSYTWDALWYHLPIVGYILQSGAIQENATPSMIDLFINIFPKNIELFFIWNTIFLNNDFLVDLSQLSFTLMGMLTVYSIGLKLCLREKHALYAAFLFFFTPIVILQSTTNYIDVAVSVLFLIGINFLSFDQRQTISKDEFLKDNEVTATLLAGLTTGILIGSKGSGPLFAVILSGFIVMKEILKKLNLLNPRYNVSFASSDHAKHERRFLTRIPLFYVTYFFIPAFLIGGYWYMKNWIIYNNPVFPMEISLFNITLFKGLYREIIEPMPDAIKTLTAPMKLFYVWRERLPYYIYDARLGGLGSLWFILMLPSVVFSLFYAIKARRYNFLSIAVVIVITFLVYPRNWNSRYVIFLVGFGSLAFGYILNNFENRQSAVKVIALILVVYTFLTANSPCVVPSKIKEFLNLPARERTIARHAPMNIDTHARKEYGLWIWLQNNLSKGDVLTYAFEPLFLSPLWNSSFSNKIVFIQAENFSEWVKHLKNYNVKYILIKKDSREDQWINRVKSFVDGSSLLSSRKERFKVLYSDITYKVLRF